MKSKAEGLTKQDVEAINDAMMAFKERFGSPVPASSIRDLMPMEMLNEIQLSLREGKIRSSLVGANHGLVLDRK